MKWINLPHCLSADINGQLKSPPIIIFSPANGANRQCKSSKNLTCYTELFDAKILTKIKCEFSTFRSKIVNVPFKLSLIHFSTW